MIVEEKEIIDQGKNFLRKALLSPLLTLSSYTIRHEIPFEKFHTEWTGRKKKDEPRVSTTDLKVLGKIRYPFSGPS